MYFPAMAFRAKRRLLSLFIAMLVALGSVAHVYAATQALMKMPAAAMESSSQDHGTDCGGNDKASCVALCATLVAILVDPVPVSSATVQRCEDVATELPLPSRNLSPNPPPPKR
jgi:hypothetical protein